MSVANRAATIYAASNPRMAGTFPDATTDELWIADMKACVPGGECRVFENVMFVESLGAVYIYGTEHEDGCPRGVKAELAGPQQVFIDFMREQNEIMDRSMGLLAAVFQGSEYASQARATAAYMIHREHLRYLAIGYRNRDGEYVCEKFEDEDEEGYLQHARATLSFDELDR